MGVECIARPRTCPEVVGWAIKPYVAGLVSMAPACAVDPLELAAPLLLIDPGKTTLSGVMALVDRSASEHRRPANVPRETLRVKGLTRS
jgi:hypothetical protein